MTLLPFRQEGANKGTTVPFPTICIDTVQATQQVAQSRSEH